MIKISGILNHVQSYDETALNFDFSIIFIEIFLLRWLKETDASHYSSAYENKWMNYLIVYFVFFYFSTIIKKRLSTDLSRITMIIYSFHSFSHMVYVDLKKLQLTQKKKYVGVFYASATFYDILVRINEAKSAVQ